MQTDSELLDGMHIGTLNGLELKIGNHILKGKEEGIEPPLSLVKRNGDQLEIVAQVAKKILFDKRPTPIPNQEKKKPKVNRYFK